MNKKDLVKKYGGTLAQWRRHKNPDGSSGGWVHTNASVGAGAHIHKGAIVCGHTSVLASQEVHAGPIIQAHAGVGGGGGVGVIPTTFFPMGAATPHGIYMGKPIDNSKDPIEQLHRRLNSLLERVDELESAARPAPTKVDPHADDTVMTLVTVRILMHDNHPYSDPSALFEALCADSDFVHDTEFIGSPEEVYVPKAHMCGAVNIPFVALEPVNVNDDLSDLSEEARTGEDITGWSARGKNMLLCASGRVLNSDKFISENLARAKINWNLAFGQSFVDIGPNSKPVFFKEECFTWRDDEEKPAPPTPKTLTGGMITGWSEEGLSMLAGVADDENFALGVDFLNRILSRAKATWTRDNTAITVGYTTWRFEEEHFTWSESPTEGSL